MRANAAVSIVVPRVLGSAFVPYSYTVVLLAMLFGGGTRQGLWSDVVVQLAALPLLVWALFKLTSAQLGRSAQWGLILLCATVALPLLQLIPLPPWLWSALPGRRVIAATYATAEMALPWLPISLDPSETWRSLLSLIPAAAIFLATLSFGGRARLVLLALVLGFVFLSVPLGLLQMMGGTASPLRFYAITNVDRAVGFFANSNHYSAFLYCAIPIAAAWGISLLHDHGPRRTVVITTLVLLIGAIVIGLSISHSRAGLALGFVGGLCTLALAWRHGGNRTGRGFLFMGLAGILFALLVAFQFGFVSLMQRVQVEDFMDDLRWSAAKVTAQAALVHMPFGSGLGTFVPVYEMFERPELLSDRYVNHAHDDWLELWLTGGVPALAIAVLFLGWFGTLAFMAWRADSPGTSLIPSDDIALARTGSIIIALLLLHSIVDYPLRTITLSVLFAAACGFLIPRVPPARAPATERGLAADGPLP